MKTASVLQDKSRLTRLSEGWKNSSAEGEIQEKVLGQRMELHATSSISSMRHFFKCLVYCCTRTIGTNKASGHLADGLLANSTVFLVEGQHDRDIVKEK